MPLRSKSEFCLCYSLETVNDLLERRRQLVVRREPGGPERVAADLGHRVLVEVGVSGRERLMDKVGVPAILSATVGNAVRTAGVNLISPALLPNQRDARDAGDLSGLRVLLYKALAEVETKVLLLLGRDVLVAEDCV